MHFWLSFKKNFCFRAKLKGTKIKTNILFEESKTNCMGVVKFWKPRKQILNI